MKLKFLTNIKILTGIALSVILLNSCSKMLEVDERDSVSPENMYQNKFDANAAVLGVYSKLKNLATEYVILNELRGDLMDVTSNADANLRAVNEHDKDISASNPYINPAPFYELILDCNDVLYNLEKMYQANKLKSYEFNERYSDVGAVRSWVYLQLINQYGAVPYITKPVSSLREIQDTASFARVGYDAMIDSLINFMETKVTFKGRYSENFINTSYMSNLGGGNYIAYTFVPKLVILGDLYLYKGDYFNAVLNYRNFINLDCVYGNINNSYEAHRVSNNVYNINQNDNTSSITNNWVQMFSQSLSTGKDKNQGSSFPTASEFEWVVPFDQAYDHNPLIDLFSWDRKYLLKPSQLAIDNWDNQYMLNGTPGDRRGRGSSWYQLGNQPIVLKYLLEYATPVGDFGLSYSPYFQGGRWYIYRAGGLNLRLAEATNRAGYPKIAYALLNNGIISNFPSGTHIPFPYYYGATLADGGYTSWYRNVGVRGRVDVKNIVVPAGSTQDSIMFIEEKLIDEAALETAFEGNRWDDLVRIAKRRDDPSFLANRVFAKLSKAGNSKADAVRTRLLNKEWFLPFKMK